MSSKTVVFWQSMVTPHMYELYQQLKTDGFAVKYIATCIISTDRLSSGWALYSNGKDDVLIIENGDDASSIIDTLPDDTQHICQGLRGNRLIREVQRLLVLKKFKYWVIIEDLNFNGIMGFLRKIYYRIEIFQRVDEFKGILAIGERSYDFFRNVLPSTSVHRFAYFLNPPGNVIIRERRPLNRFVFIGRLDENKGLEIIFNALAHIKSLDFKFSFVGGGPLEKPLIELALRDHRVEYLGVLPHREINCLLQDQDVLVIMSKHDGWGAVVVEALMSGLHVVGTPGVGAAFSLRKAPCVHLIPRDSVELSRTMNAFIMEEVSFSLVDQDLYRSNFSVRRGALHLRSILGLSKMKGGELWSWK